MRDFDPARPLIFIHVPKTAGTSVRHILEGWFPDRFHPHYFNKRTKTLPPRLDLASSAFSTTPPVIYGHFNRDRGFGVEAYYPDVRQFITILRDPLDMHVSTYFFIRQSPKHRLHNALSKMPLETFIQTERPNILEHFPRHMNSENFQSVIEEFFIDIGCFETLEASLVRIGTRLSKPTRDLAVPHLNPTARDDSNWQSYRDWFRGRWPLEHSLFDYARANAPDTSRDSSQAY